MESIRYLQELSRRFPTIARAATEIINLSSELQLPKGTEHFISDIHGEYEAFLHILKNGSGSVRKKIHEEFDGELTHAEIKSFATLIYYPEQKLELLQPGPEWYRTNIERLIRLTRRIAGKYTRAYVREALPQDFSYVIEELLAEKEVESKADYVGEIISAVIRTGRARECVLDFCKLIQRLTIYRLHVLGDIYDRGPGAHIIMDTLMHYHSVDIQWGNHDINWMGAAAGAPLSLINVVRLCARYGNLATLEEGYGINLIPLARFALDVYEDDPCSCFRVSYTGEGEHDVELDRKIHKAAAVIQFKLEGQYVARHPELAMENRRMLDKIDYRDWTVEIDGNTYELEDVHFPTIDPKSPNTLTAGEQKVLDHLISAFRRCEKLQRHVRFLYTRGSMYLVHDNNLLYHGCVPLNQDGTLKEVTLFGKTYRGKALYDILEEYARKGYYARDEQERLRGQDVLWFIWSHENSPLFGKEKMATFERYLVSDESTHREEKNPYYRYVENEQVVNSILSEFGLDESGHIINGHVPVLLKSGESPVKCGGKLLIIDGGMSRGYHEKTGIAGYTLIANSYGMRLVAHEAFVSTEEAISEEKDIHSVTEIISSNERRLCVADTDRGREMAETVRDLEALLAAYRGGVLREQE